MSDLILFNNKRNGLQARSCIEELWEYGDENRAARFLDKWFWWATHSRIKQMRNFAWLMKKHLNCILSWFDEPVSNAAVEGMNGKAKAIMRRAYGIRTFEMPRLVLLHNLGKLPESNFSTHKFL